MILNQWEGYSLCSQREPCKEASDWVLKQTQLIQDDCAHVWILGVGAGYHLRAFTERFTNTIVSAIDHRGELLKRLLQNFPETSRNLMLEEFCDEPLFVQSKSFQFFGTEQSPILTFHPAIQGCENIYRNIEDSLNGRTPLSFFMMSELFQMGLDSKATLQLREYQIKEISKLVDIQASPEAKKIVRLLRGLVK